MEIRKIIAFVVTAMLIFVIVDAAFAYVGFTTVEGYVGLFWFLVAAESLIPLISVTVFSVIAGETSPTNGEWKDINGENRGTKPT